MTIRKKELQIGNKNNIHVFCYYVNPFSRGEPLIFLLFSGDREKNSWEGDILKKQKSALPDRLRRGGFSSNPNEGPCSAQHQL